MSNIFIHKTSEVNTKIIGMYKIWQYVIVLERAIIGKNCNINCFVFIENDVYVSNNNYKDRVQLWDGIKIGNNVFVGPNATFTNDLYPKVK